MSVFNYKTGLGNSSAYQVSAVPYIIRGSTSATNVYEANFTNVTNFIQISASGPLRIGFSSLGVTANENYFVTPEGVSDIYYWRVASLYLQKTGSGGGNRSFEIRAGVTTIAASELSNNWSGSAGVG
jgi:hypothetical protein